MRANFIFLILEGTCKLVDGTRIRAVIKRGTFLGEFPLLACPHFGQTPNELTL